MVDFAIYRDERDTKSWVVVVVRLYSTIIAAGFHEFRLTAFKGV